MRIAIFLLSTILLSSCGNFRKVQIIEKEFSSNESYVVTLICMDAFNNEPFRDCEIFKNDSLIGKSNSEGELTIQFNVNDRDRNLDIKSPDDLHDHESVLAPYYNSTKTVYLYPNKVYENIIWANEDSLFGFYSKEKMTKNEFDKDKFNAKNEDSSDAQFPGGSNMMTNHISAYVKYPKKAILLNITGKVHVYYLVQKDGTISHILASPETDLLLNREAIRVVRNMPKWEPGSIKGENVRTRCRLPIHFKLD